MGDTTTLNETLRSPLDGTEFVRLATPGANWKATVASILALHGSVFYVSPTGLDSNDSSSPARAWQTIAKVNAATLYPGDSILFADGQTFAGAIVCSAAGTSSYPITYGSYNAEIGGGANGQATINSGSNTGLNTQGLPGIVVRDLIFIGTSAANHGIYASVDNLVDFSVGFTTINCTFNGYGLNGLFTSFYTDVIVQGCAATNCCSFADALITAGINVQNCNNIRVLDYCISYGNPGTVTTVETGLGFHIAGCVGGVVEKCLAYSNGASARSTLSNHGGPSGFVIQGCTNVKTSDCVSHDNTVGAGKAVDGNGYLLGGSTGSDLVNCLSYNNFGAGFLIFNGSSPSVDGNLDNCKSINDGGGAGSNAPDGILISREGNASGILAVNVNNCIVYQPNASTNAIEFRLQGSSTNITGNITGNTLIVTGAQNQIKTDSNPSASALVISGNKYSGGGTFSWNGVSYSTLTAFSAATSQESAFSHIIASELTIQGSGAGATFADTEASGHTWDIGTEVVGGQSNFFFFDNNTGRTEFAVNYTGGHSGAQLGSGSVWGWTSNANADQGSIDTGISRIAPVSSVPIVAFGNGTAGDASAAFKVRTKAGAPTAADVPVGTCQMIHDTVNNTTKWYYNNAGTLQVSALL
jgi:hypothetical protein